METKEQTNAVFGLARVVYCLKILAGNQKVICLNPTRSGQCL